MKRDIHIRLPVEVAIRYEYQASLLGMSLNQYLIHLLADVESKFANKRQDEMYEMLTKLYDNYFENDYPKQVETNEKVKKIHDYCFDDNQE